MATVTREFRKSLDELAGMRAFARDQCLSAWGDDATSDDLIRLELALQEAAANVIRHGSFIDPERPIRLTADVDADQICLTLVYQGEPFSPESVAPPSFDGSRSGGFGVYLIKECLDEVEYLNEQAGCAGIRMVKKRSRKAHS